MDKLKIGIIGAGQITNTTHLVNLKEMNNAEVVSICDNNFDNAKNTAEKFNIDNYYDNYKSMINENELDAVFVCVPNKFHFDATMFCLENGCNVLCEKPPAINYAQSLAMEKKALEKGVLLSYGFHFRHSKGVSITKNKIDNGEFGTIYSAKAIWHRKRGVPGWGNFINKEMQGGGPLIDIGCHMLDLALYFLDYKEISYVCSNTSDYLAKETNAFLMGEYDKSKFTVEDNAFGFIKFKDNTSLIIETSFALNMEKENVRDVVLYGSKKGSTLFPLKFYGEENGLLKTEEFNYDIEKDLHKKSVTNFVNACLGKEKLLVTAKQGTYVQNVVDKIYESANKGVPIFLNEGE